MLRGPSSSCRAPGHPRKLGICSRGGQGVSPPPHPAALPIPACTASRAAGDPAPHLPLTARPRVPSPLCPLLGALGNDALQFLHPINPGSAEAPPAINERCAIPHSSSSLILLSFEASPRHRHRPSVRPTRAGVLSAAARTPCGGTPSTQAGALPPGWGHSRALGPFLGGRAVGQGKEEDASSRRAGRMERWRREGGRGGSQGCRGGWLPATSVRPPGRSR